MNLLKFVVNGLYIPFFFAAHYWYYKDFFHTSIISLKMYSTNYFFWFNDCYKYRNIPASLNWIKQFVRFTDTGHIISFLYYYYPSLLPVAFNTHFIITTGYWVGRIFFEMKDCDELNESVIMTEVVHIFCRLNHSLPLFLFIYEIWKNPYYAIFDFTSLYYSYLWVFGWLLFIYTPWRIITNDHVYNIFHPNAQFNTIFMFIGIIFCLFVFSNTCGYLLTKLENYLIRDVFI